MTMGMNNREVAVLERQARAQEALAAAINSGMGEEFRKEREALEKAHEVAEVSTAEAKRREAAALKAEADATRARQALADETEKARTELHRRFTAVTERERLAGECETSQEARDKELTRREEHLKKDGVRGF